MLTIQILLLFFFFFAILKIGGRWRGGEITGRGAILWVIFWLLAAVVALEPDATFYLARAVGIGRGADLVVYLALTLIFFLLFRIIVKVEKINRDITKLTRRMALKEKEKL